MKNSSIHLYIYLHFLSLIVRCCYISWIQIINVEKLRWGNIYITFSSLIICRFNYSDGLHFSRDLSTWFLLLKKFQLCPNFLKSVSIKLFLEKKNILTVLKTCHMSICDFFFLQKLLLSCVRCDTWHSLIQFCSNFF